MSTPGQSREGTTSPQVPQSTIPLFLERNPLIDPSVPSDDFREGVRFSIEVLKVAPVPGYKSLVTNVARTNSAGGNFTFFTINTPKPPPNEVLSLFQLIELVKDGEGRLMKGVKAGVPSQRVMQLPFFTWKQYQTMYHWLHSITNMGGNETIWKQIAAGDIKMVHQIEVMAALFNTFHNVWTAYGSILYRFGKSKGFGAMPQEWWDQQASIVVLSSVDGMYATFHSILSTFSPAPHYRPPTSVEFTWTLATPGGKSGPSVIEMTRNYFAATQAKLVTLLAIYAHAYPALYNSFKQKYMAWEFMLGEQYVKDWIRLAGKNAIAKEDYPLLMGKWGVVIVPKEMEAHEVNRVLLEDKNQLPAPRYPGPNATDAKFLQELHTLFGTREKAMVPIHYLVKAGEFFTTSGFPKPLKDTLNWNIVAGKLKDPDQWRSCIFIFNAYIQEAYKVSLLCFERSDGWKKPYEDWIWNAFGLTKQQQEDLKHNDAPFDGEYARTKWPQPWALKGEELKEYLNYQSGPMEHGYPRFRDKKIAEDAESFDVLVRTSQAYYDKWRNLILASPERLKKYPVKLPIDVVIDGEKTQIINYYPDLGVWYHEEGSPWKQAVNFLFHPWKELTGKSLMEDILGQVKKIVNVLWPLLAKAVDDLSNDVMKLALAAGGIGIVFIFGLREVSNFQEKNKKEAS